MNNSSITAFVNKLVEASPDLGLKPVTNPEIRYARVRHADPPSVAEDSQPSGNAAKKLSQAAPTAVPRPVAAPAEAAEAKAEDEGVALKFDLSDQGLLNGLVLSEVLGRPRCFSRPYRRPAAR